MDSTQRISERGRPQNLNQSYYVKKSQDIAQTVQVSDDQSVQGEHKSKVAGVASDRRASLGKYRNLLSGTELPVMTQLLGANKDEESVARKALERPDVTQNPINANTSEEAQGAQEETQGAEETQKGEGQSAEGTEETKKPKTGKNPDKSVSGEELTPEDQKEVDKLQARDREVRAHEQAHVAAGGQHIRGGIQYDYQRGPDGRNYAVGGHVNIDVSEEKTPEATVTKMQQVKRAALAPAEPSGADRAVAAAASQKEQTARAEIVEERQTESEERRTESVKKSRASQGEKASAAPAESSASSAGEATAEGVDSSSQSVAPSDIASAAPPSVPTSDNQIEIPKPDTPQPRENMNLAREARMRIKRGITWQA